jgi:hypothetical protein
MATVFPATLTFYTGVAGASQVRGVSVTGENVYVTVDEPPTGPFHWNASPTGGWLLNPPPPPRPPGSGTHAGPAVSKPPMVIPVTFTQPPSTAPVHATVTVNIQRNDATRSAIPGFPVKIALEGSAGGGVGPGMVKILRVVANPAGPDLAGEFVEIINPTDATVDLAGCTVGDLRGRGGRRPLYSFASSYTLDPVSSTAPRRLLRIFTGPGVPTDPAFLQIPLSRGAPVWNNAGDTAWITNSLG